MLAVRDFDEVRIASRTPEHAQKLAAELPEADASPSVEEAVRGADVVVTVTNSAEPVLEREWLKAGAHVNAVGACFPTTRELDSATVADSSFFVDRRESAVNEAGDYLLALEEGAIGPDHIRAEIGEILIGSHPVARRRTSSRSSSPSARGRGPRRGRVPHAPRRRDPTAGRRSSF